MERTPRESLLQVALEDALKLLADINYLKMGQKSKASRIGDLAQQCGCDVPVEIRTYSRERAMGYVNSGGSINPYRKDKIGRGRFR